MEGRRGIFKAIREYGRTRKFFLNDAFNVKKLTPSYKRDSLSLSSSLPRSFLYNNPSTGEHL